MAITTQKETKGVPFSEEDVCIVSKADPFIMWAGSKTMYSGLWDGEPQQASGYNYASGESDLEPINALSGFSRIRIPELNQLHKIFVFPKNPHLIARPDYFTMTGGVTSGLPTGDGGCSGKVATLHWQNICSGCSYVSGINPGAGGSGQSDAFQFLSGVVDVIAFGSQN